MIVEFDRDGLPIGDSGGLLSGVIGQLARNGTLFPINFKDWPAVPDEMKNDCFNRMVQVNILLFYFTS